MSCPTICSNDLCDTSLFRAKSLELLKSICQAVSGGGSDVAPGYAVIAPTVADTDIVEAVEGKNILVTSLVLSPQFDVQVVFNSDPGGDSLSGVWDLMAGVSFVLPYNPVGWFMTELGQSLSLNLSSVVAIEGCLTYRAEVIG